MGFLDRLLYFLKGAPKEPFVQKDSAFFAEVLATEFPQYTVQNNVSPARFGGVGQNLDFVLFEGETPVGAVVLVEHNGETSAGYKAAKETCLNAGVPFINFFLHMPNERGFVIGRIGRNVRKLPQYSG